LVKPSLSSPNTTTQPWQRRVADALKLGPAFDPEWTLPSMLDRNPLVWMAEVNGYLVDIRTRTMPREVQEIAFEKGLIPYIPYDHT
jgi:hypothetical protein